MLFRGAIQEHNTTQETKESYREIGIVYNLQQGLCLTLTNGKGQKDGT